MGRADQVAVTVDVVGTVGRRPHLVVLKPGGGRPATEWVLVGHDFALSVWGVVQRVVFRGELAAPHVFRSWASYSAC